MKELKWIGYSLFCGDACFGRVFCYGERFGYKVFADESGYGFSTLEKAKKYCEDLVRIYLETLV